MDTLNLSFPITKVDKTRRVVTGVATADNLDPEGDIVDFNASVEAFKDWIGNIREMHQPKSVGKTLDYRIVKVPYNGHMYDGIEVDAYISKGAEDTWQKVLDGTLKGFSVGGQVLQRVPARDKNTGREGSKIADYRLGELSLVDNPGNPAALISMVKSATNGSLHYVLGKYNIYYCKEHNVAQLEDGNCPSEGHHMEWIGATETKDSNIIRKAVLGYLNVVINDHSDVIKKSIESEGEIMADLQNNEVDDNVDNMELTDTQKESIAKRLTNFLFGSDVSGTVSTTNAVPYNINIYSNGVPQVTTTEGETVITDVVEKSVETEAISEQVEEVSEEDGGNEVDLDLLKEMLSGVLAEQLTAVKEEISASVDEKIDAIQKSVDEVKEQTETALTEVKDEVEKVADSGAMKKSVDETGEESGEKIEKSASNDSLWGGIFVPREWAEVLGYES